MTFFKLRWPYHLIPLGLIFVAGGLVWSGEQHISWAAPQQNPYLQTIPTRPPTVEPGPTAEPTPPTEPTPPAEPTLPSDEGNDNEGGDDDGDEPASGQPPAQASDQAPTEAEEAVPTLEPSSVDQPAIAQPEINTNAPVESQLPQEEDKADELDLTRPQQANSGSEVTPDMTTSGEVSTGTGPDHPDSLAAAPAASDINMKLPFYQTGSLLWLYLLGLGVILIISGVYLVKRA
jgi:hypothetical protein